MKINTKLRILEFVVAGILLDFIENILTVKFGTDAELDADLFLIALVVVIPFAILTELVIDHPRFWSKILRLKDTH